MLIPIPPEKTTPPQTSPLQRPYSLPMIRAPYSSSQTQQPTHTLTTHQEIIKSPTPQFSQQRSFSPTQIEEIQSMIEATVVEEKFQKIMEFNPEKRVVEQLVECQSFVPIILIKL